MKPSCSSKFKGIHIMAKPVGAFCNLKCTYCYYLEKQAFYTHRTLQVMNNSVLQSFIQQYTEMNRNQPQLQFVWQGGEPMLAGISFYEDAVRLQKKYAGGKTIFNSLQTNGILLDETWCGFLKRNQFTVGISLDGPEEITDFHRKDRAGNPVLKRVMHGIHLLQEYKIPYTVLACVTKESCGKPLEIYRFFREQNIRHIQFTPVVERVPEQEEEQAGQMFASPSCIPDINLPPTVTEWSVPRGSYGTFLNTIFDLWSDTDVGMVFIQNFEWALASWLGLPSSVCTFSESCGTCGILEHNGDVYSCDHYMYPEYRLGNLADSSLGFLMNSPSQACFSRMKLNLPPKCLSCNVRFACHGECPRHRFIPLADNSGFESYLCRDYQKFFRHIHPKVKAMAQLVSNGFPASDVMTLKDRPIVIYKKP